MTSAPAKLLGFVVGLAAVFAVATLVGGVVPTIDAAPAEAEGMGADEMMASDSRNDTMASDGEGHGGAGEPGLPGLSVSEAGYTLVPLATDLRRGASVPFRFSIQGPDGEPLTDYRVTHERELHLVVVTRDLSRFQHVHPLLTPEGTWKARLQVPVAGTYRVFADFQPATLDEPLTLGADVNVAGSFVPVAVPQPSHSATTGPYEVTVAGDSHAGAVSELTFTVRRQGRQIDDLAPYLGAAGHLVALRVGDLAYLHTHPVEEDSADSQTTSQIRFGVEFPTPGTYRMFLDFNHDGAVRTAAFTVDVPIGMTEGGSDDH